MDEINYDSDRELQVAFKKGLLKNLVRQTEKVIPKKTNNKQGLQESLESFKKSLPWVETLDVCIDPVPLPNCVDPALASNSAKSGKEDENHMKLENLFYRQAQAAVLFGLEKLKKLNIPTQRPNDYYAEMAKSDVHMKKVKEKLLSLQAIKEKADKAKKDREARKFNKLAAKEAKNSKKKEKLKNKDQLKKMKKKHNFGKNDADGDDEKKTFKGGNSKPKKDVPNRKKDAPNRPGQKRNLKNKKYGFGGQKKRSKMNNKNSFNDV